MRGICKSGPANGDRRTITKFALFPICTEGREWRWLETVTIEQEFLQDYSNYDSWESECWKDLRFVD